MAKSCFLGRKEIQFRRSRWLSEVLACKRLLEENYSTRHNRGGSLMIKAGGASHIEENLNYNLSVVDKKQMLNGLSLAQEGRRLRGEGWIFQQDNAAILNAPITKKYLLEQKISLLDHPACFSDFSHIENLWGLIVAKVYEGGRQYSAISELKNAILDT